MPAVVSHYLLAERVYNQLTKTLPQLNRTAFLWGASGPDIFFAHRIMPWQQEKSLARVSHVMHGGKPEQLLNFLYFYADSKENYVLLSYAFGFITHYAFDSLAHPYILDYANKQAKDDKINIPFLEDIKLSSVYHNQIEGYLDTLFLMKEKRIPISQFRIEKSCPKDEKCAKAIAEVLCAYIKAYSISPYVSEREIIRAQNDWYNCLVAINDRFSLKKAFISSCERLLKAPPLVSVFLRSTDIDCTNDYANLRHNEWISEADDKKHHDSFFELADKAEEKSLILTEKLLSGEFLTKDDCFESFSGRRAGGVPPLSISRSSL